MPIFPLLKTEGLVQSGDKTRLDASQSFASGNSELSSVSIRPSPDQPFFNTGSDHFLDWVYDHSGGDDDPEEVVATVRAGAKTVVDETNDKIDFTLSVAPDTVVTASVAHGEYPSHVELFAAIETALNAATATAYPDLAWSVSVGDGGVTVITADGLDVVSGDTIELLPESGPNFTTSILPIIGFEEDIAVSRPLIPLTSQAFAQDFAADTGFTYDAAKAEFVGGLVRQKDQRPTDGVFGATYTSAKDINWITSGSLAGVDIGAPSLVGGKLACLGGGNTGVKYSNANIGASGNVGAFRLRYTPNYSGTPATNTTIFEFAPPSGNADKMLVFHSATGTLRLTAYTSAGTVKHSAAVFSATPWAPVAGTSYELELDWDTVAGIVRLFVNGVLFGSMGVSSYARGTTATDLYIGAGTAYPIANASFDDLLLFSTAQHASGYTPGYTVPEAIYTLASVTLPVFTYGGAGTIQALTNFTTTEGDAPRYTLNGKYFDGSAWVASDGSYAQANAKATVLASLASLVVGIDTLAVVAVLQESNTQASVAQLDVTYTGQQFDDVVEFETAEAPSDLHREKAVTLRIVTEETDNLFSNDSNLVEHEFNIMKFLPDGRSSFIDRHREAQNEILAWLDTHGFVDDYGNKFTVEDIKNPEDLEKWATFTALKLIFEGVHNAEDDVFEKKAKKYDGLATFYRNRANVRIDINADGTVTEDELLDTRSGRILRR